MEHNQAGDHMFNKGDAVTQWPETLKGIVVGYYWDEHIDEPMYHIEWSDGETTTEYKNQLSRYCCPDADTEDLEDNINQTSDARTREGEQCHSKKL